MKTPALLLAFLCLSVSTMLAQKSLEGYLIPVEGDTIWGTWTEFFDQRGELQVRVESENGEKLSGSASTILEYGREGEYKRESFSLPDKEGIVKPVFLRCLLIGEPSLYVDQESPAGDLFYLAYDSEDLIELPRPVEEIVREDGVLVRKEDNHFRQVLARQMTACVSLYQNVMEVDYREAELVKILQTYHACAGIPRTTLKTKETSPIKIGALAYGAILPVAQNDELLLAYGGGLTAGLELFRSGISLELELIRQDSYYASGSYAPFGMLLVQALGRKKHFMNEKTYFSYHLGLGLLRFGADIEGELLPGGLGKFFGGVGMGKQISPKVDVELFARCQYLGLGDGVWISMGLAAHFL